ncbi:unnamed protein product [Vitrella brassicaformis CCMP3155]|uniref:BTB domain-containing protein n=1 Tax=Vitrella brassicaformis (strain CCMP3155) TaxID=1169540 RepID=A0A0G4GHU1_VITBC|nr:unnamed protein product [Vitrella brassicaformis CCMP3155]|eukprot:CEM29310.1 unnamed protein product [Vitrella brassicaformis CCMP3155]
MSVEVVKLNVGGKAYEVAKSTLSKHPNTLLAKLVDDQWRPSQAESIFIDANGDLFEYVLDFYRRGTPVHVPHNISKAQLQKEFSYFNIDMPEDKIAISKVPFAEVSRIRNGKMIQLQEEAEHAMNSLSRETDFFS